MNPGDYRHKIDFYSVDRYGAKSFYKTKGASFKTLSSNQVLTAKSIDVVISHEVRIRYCTDIKKSMVFYKGTRKFTIETVVDIDEKHEELRITCNEVV